MNLAEKGGGSGADRTPRTATNANQATEAYTDPHAIAMYGMAWRIRWLTRHGVTHWWLRTPDGHVQLEFLQGRDAE